ncbi:MAG: DHHW family protein [Candidatus Limivicinus sp.]|jgi:hypothetical protein
MKIKEKLTVAVLAGVLVLGLLLHLILPDAQLSREERRHLEQRPEFTVDSVLSGEYAKDTESYLLDQFPLRNGFRSIKSLWSYYVLGQRDVDGIFIRDGSASKLGGELDERQIDMFTDKMNALREKYFPDSKVSCLILPDKNYYLTMDGKYPGPDYEALYGRVEAGLPWAEQIDVRDCLDAKKYYATDSHWQQENLQAVRDRIADKMELELPEWNSYRETVLPGFYGVYYGQAALPMPPEELIYLENDVTDSAVVTGPELKGEQKVYAPERFSGMDGYDVFLHGAQAVVNIENPLAGTDRELIIFRDSFGSSLAPLLLPGYRTVTLIDTRYVNPAFLDRFVDFHGQEVLLLYSASMVNSAAVLQ